MRKRAPRTVVVQIPCYNEAGTLPAVLASIPHRVARGVRVLTLVVDDGSTDGTADVARRAGADLVVRHTRNRGLAAAFRTGLATALRLGADVVVNTDGDNQYPQAEIPRLVEPILDGTADIVVADRQTGRVAHFSPLKKLLQAVGSAVVRAASGTGVRDAPSGFRAYSREAALRLYVHSDYSYTLETLIQAGAQRLRVVSVPVTVNPRVRESRLMSSLPSYLIHSAAAILRAYATYRPLAVFSLVGALFLLVGTAGILRFLYYVVTEGGAGHVQSVMLAATLWAVGVMIVLNGLQADLTAANRRLAEEALYELRRDGGSRPTPRGRIRRAGAAEIVAGGRSPVAVSPPTGGSQPNGRAWRRSAGRPKHVADQPAPQPTGSRSRPRTRR